MLGPDNAIAKCGCKLIRMEPHLKPIPECEAKASLMKPARRYDGNTFPKDWVQNMINAWYDYDVKP